MVSPVCARLAVRVDLPLEAVEISAGDLHLRPWEPGDAGQVFAICQDAAIQRFTSVPAPYTLADARSFVGEVSPAGWASGTAAHFAVLAAATGEVLASVSLMHLHREGRRGEIGVWCAPAARGRGVTSAAAGAVCRWAFAALELERVEWLAAPDNLSSQRAAVRAGFVPEGVLRGRIRLRGRQYDAWVASRLPSDG